MKANGRIIKIEKNLCAQAADKTSIFSAPLLLKALATDSKKAQRSENINHTIIYCNIKFSSYAGLTSATRSSIPGYLSGS